MLGAYIIYDREEVLDLCRGDDLNAMAQHKDVEWEGYICLIGFDGLEGK